MKSSNTQSHSSLLISSNLELVSVIQEAIASYQGGKELVDGKSLSKWLGLSYDTVSGDLIHRRGFPKTQIGKRTYYIKSEVLKFLIKNTDY